MAQSASRVVLFGNSEFDDPQTPPFTLYGLVSKRFLIEEMQGEKIVSRKKGTTVTACATAVEASAETPDKIGLPAALKVGLGELQTCSVQKFAGAVAKTSDLRPACVPACRDACVGSLDRHSSRLKLDTGFALVASDRARVENACVKSCVNSCGRPGRSFEFVVPFRP